MAVHAAKRVVTSPRRPAAPAGDPILATKITAPGVPDWAVQRPRITKLIAQGTRWCPLTVVTGPVGSGKTMALALWAAAEPGPVGSGKTMALALWAAAEPGPVAWVCLDKYNSRRRRTAARRSAGPASFG